MSGADPPRLGDGTSRAIDREPTIYEQMDMLSMLLRTCADRILTEVEPYSESLADIVAGAHSVSTSIDLELKRRGHRRQKR